MSKKLKVGDIFYLKLKETENYIFGRLLFDVKKQYHKMIAPEIFTEYYSPYLRMFYSECQLVEMYEGVYEKIEDYIDDRKVIIPRVLTLGIDSKRNVLGWGVLKNKKVDYTQVDFPEHLNYGFNKVALNRGELVLDTSLKEEDAEKIDIRSTMCVPITVAYASLHFQNRRDLIPEDVRRESYLEDNDLYYHPELRRKIYADLNIDPNKSYYGLSKEMGFDLERFY